MPEKKCPFRCWLCLIAMSVWVCSTPNRIRLVLSPRTPPSMKTRELGALVYAAYVSTTIYLTVITTTDDCR